MKTVSFPEASAFVAAGSTWPGPFRSVEDAVNQASQKGLRFVEGTQAFEDLRGTMMGEAEAYLGMSAVSFSRALLTLRDVASHWSIVGLYYSSFFAAKAIMAMFGCWSQRRRLWIDFDDSDATARALVLHKTPYPVGPKISGSHEVFWWAYYQVARQIQPWLDAKYTAALVPISSSETWFIGVRNEYNYRPDRAVALMSDFAATFDGSAIPGCFPGDLATGHRVAATLHELGRDLADQFGLKSVALAGFGDRKPFIRRAVAAWQESKLRRFASKESRRVAC